MNALRLVSVTAAMALCYAMSGCGSDENNNGGAGTGGVMNAAGTGGRANATGGNSGTGGSAGSGTGGTVTTEQCLASHFSDPGITAACKSCMCECNAAAASKCDVNCWSLTRCVQVDCASNPMDFTCITSKCSAFLLGGAQTAMPLTSCFTKCGPVECAGWFLAGSGGAGAGGNSGTGGGGGTSGGSPGSGGSAVAGSESGGSGGEGG